MRLIMLFGNEVIDQIMIDCNKLGKPGYISDLQEALIYRNEEMLECCADSPNFAIENVPSKQAFQSLSIIHDTQLL